MITQEDIALIPFDVCLDGHHDESPSIPYMYTLNRDKQSDATVMGKKAVACTKQQALVTLNQKVSFKYTLGCTVHHSLKYMIGWTVHYSPLCSHQY
jgi:hypothetical protein